MISSTFSDFKICKNVPTFTFGQGAFSSLGKFLEQRRSAEGRVAFYLDHFFLKDKQIFAALLPTRASDLVVYVDTTKEPSTHSVNALLDHSLSSLGVVPDVVVGIGGGSTLDVAKALSNLFRNPGRAEDYQGWDLLKSPGVFKIGVPTISGTGAEASRTCVMTNYEKRLKLGMNSEFTVFDHLILDPNLSETVPRDQYFFTGMDTYIHCLESLDGRFRNPVGDAFSREALRLCQEIYSAGEMQSVANREKLMVASYLGGCAIGFSFVGLVHPFSAALSVVLGIHHCVANCIVLSAMGEFYPQWVPNFSEMARQQGVLIPSGVTTGLSDDDWEGLYQATIVHEKPLANALGDNFRDTLTREKVRQIFSRM